MNNIIQSFYNWYRNTIRNPKYRWWLILGTCLYLFSPIDIAPDFIPVLGWIDDAVVMTLLVSEVSQLLVDQVKLRQNQNPEQASSANKQGETVDVDAIPLK